MRPFIIWFCATALCLAAGAFAAESPAAADFERAERYFDGKDFLNAARLYRQVLEAEPAGPLAAAAGFRLGMCQFALGEYDAAAAAFHKFEEGFPTSPYLDDAAFLSAQAFFRMGEYHKCFERLLRVLSFGKQTRYYGRAVRGLGNLADESLTAEELRKRLQDYRRSPEAAKVLLKLGKHEQGRGDYEKAVVFLDAVARDYPDTKEGKEAQQALVAAREKVGRAPNVVGALLPLTGDCAVYGTAMKAAVELAAEEYNGRREGALVQVYFEDTAAGAAEAARRLIFDRRAICLLGPALSEDVRAVAPMCRDYQIPALSPAATEGGVEKLNGYVFLNGLTFESETNAMVSYAMDELKLKRFAVLYPANTYGRGMAAAFAAAVKARGGDFAGETEYPLIDMTLDPNKREINYSPVTKQVKWMRADAVYIPGHYTEIVRLLPQLTFSDVSSYLLGANGWNENRVIRVGGKYVEGTYFTAGFNADDADPEVRNFVAAYRRRTAEFPNYLAAQAYDAANILFACLYPAAKNGAEVKARLDAVKDFDGVTGKTTLRGPDGILAKDVIILTVREGEVVTAPR